MHPDWGLCEVRGHNEHLDLLVLPESDKAKLSVIVGFSDYKMVNYKDRHSLWKLSESEAYAAINKSPIQSVNGC